MKISIFIWILLLAGLWSCNSIDARFEEKDKLQLIMMEVIEQPYANPGDKYTFKLMAQSGSGLERVEISNLSHELDTLPGLPSIVLAEEVTVDSAGYLSHPVKTAIIQYPIIVPALPGENISINFTVTSVSGIKQTVKSSMLVANYKEGKQLFFANTYKAKNWAFYSTEKMAYYGFTAAAATYYKKNVSVIDFYSISDGAKEYFIFSPDEPDIEGYMKAHGDKNYVSSEMRRTRMVKLQGIDYKKAQDKEILAIDFTNAVTKVQVKKGDNIGFILVDGRKGIMNIIGAAGKYIDFKCKTQTIAQ